MCGCRKARLLAVAAGTRGSAGSAPAPVAFNVAPELTIEVPSTAVWGPLLWKILHITAHKSGKNANEGATWKNIFNSLKNVIPCSECKMHFVKYLNATDFKLTGPGTPTFRTYICQWLHTFHNVVNARIGKPIVPSVIDYSHLNVTDYITGFGELVPIFVRAGLINRSSWDTFKHNIMKLN
jgi:hypothetical protein